MGDRQGAGGTGEMTYISASCQTICAKDGLQVALSRASSTSIASGILVVPNNIFLGDIVSRNVARPGWGMEGSLSPCQCGHILANRKENFEKRNGILVADR